MTDCEKNKSKLKRKSISLDTKMIVLKRLENGERQVDIGNDLNLATSTIRTILRNKDKIKLSASTTTLCNAARITRSRSKFLEEMENRLSIWIDEEIRRNKPLSRRIIMRKAKNIFNNIQIERKDTSESFVASRGWYFNFQKRKNFRNINDISTEAFPILQSKLEKNSKNLDPLQLAVQEMIVGENGESVCNRSTVLDIDFIRNSLQTITEIADQIVAIDPNFDRSSKARREILNAIACYQHLLDEKEIMRQMTTDDLFPKKIGSEETAHSSSYV